MVLLLESFLLTDYFGDFYSIYCNKYFIRYENNELFTSQMFANLELSLKVGFEIDFYCFLKLLIHYQNKINKVNCVYILFALKGGIVPESWL